MLLKRLLIKSSSGPFVRRGRFICTILVEGIIGTIPVNFIQICNNDFRKGLRVIHRGTTDEDRLQKPILSLRRMQAFCFM